MTLTQQDADLFFSLMLNLQFFVREQLGMLPECSDIASYKRDCSSEEKVQARNAVYDNPHLIKKFVQENPQGLRPEELAIVSGWQQFVRGRFFIERLLKKYAIFIPAEESKQVYGVLGLNQSLDEMVHPSQLPRAVHAVLLPFKGKVVYDGVLNAYDIYFGGNYTAGLKERYLVAKQNNRIVDSFDVAPVLKPAAKPKTLRDWQPQILALQEQAKALKSGNDYPALYAPAFALLKASLDFAEGATAAKADVDALYTILRKVDREMRKAYKVLNREER